MTLIRIRSTIYGTKTPMGTNYYWREPNFTPDTNPDAEWGELKGRHIGKSSAGWCFSIHIYPEDNINNLSDWEELFFTTGSSIINEYGESISPIQMLKTIENRKWTGQEWTPERLGQNSAIKGPNGLARHSYRATHGEGTYDYITGYFS